MSNNNIHTQNNEQQGKKSSLWHLASENAIVIPVIQRDYAQGRIKDNVRQIREPFLKKMFKVLANNNSKLELDFIYGSLEFPKDISIKKVEYENFVPLDGQQRLTTLFLLHWFLSIWNSNDFDSMKNHFNGRFSYMTRLSSNEFCSEILNKVCSQEVVDSILSHEKNAISKLLRNEGWFHNQWMNDPTIGGMLTMLDTMSDLFKEAVGHNDRAKMASVYFNRLSCNNIEETAITFNLLYLNRGDFHLSDELYIKMNSRGRPLSDFETFKARFESFMTRYTTGKNDFASNIDGEWADVYWKLRNNIRPKSEEGKSNYYRDNTDGMMMNTIKVAIANEYAILAENNDYGLDELFESQVAKTANPEMHLTFYRYTELGVLNDIKEEEINEDEEQEKKILKNNETICLSVYNAFRFIHDIKGKYSEKYVFDSEFMNINEQLNNILFYGIDGKNSVISSITYQTRLLFWALSKYCIKYKDNIENCTQKKYRALNQWMRFIRNMVESTEYNDVYDMQKALKYLNSVFHCMKEGNIITYLSSLEKTPDCSPFPQSQIKEEILKAQLISCDETWEKTITEADNVPSWPGRSGYLLYFSGLSDKSYKDILNLSSDENRKYMNLFDSYKQKMDVLLSYLNNNDYRAECLLERALLAKGCYLRKEDKKSIIHSMMDKSVTSRSYSFRQMVQFNGISSDEDNSIYKNGVECLKGVLDDQLFLYNDIENVKESLNNIIKQSTDKIQDWRWPLLVNKNIWNEAWQRFMWIDDKGTAWVVRQRGGGTNQYETWSYHLYLLLSSMGLKYGYYPHSYPRHTILNFIVDKQMYQLKIRHTSTGEWRFDMIAIDENYQIIPLNTETRKFIFRIMPNNARTFFKKNIEEAVIWAKAMQECIKNNGELL